MISAVVLTKDEENNIEKCLQSLLWCDEIIVVDDFSTDRTLKLVEELKKDNKQIKIHQCLLSNDFAAQHNFGLSKATCDWVLFIDADEIVSPSLQKEIKENLKSHTNGNRLVAGFTIKRSDYFLGRKIKYGEAGSLSFLRLARKNAGIWKREVHEYWKVNGEIRKLSNPLEHYSHHSLGQFISQINFHSSIDARHISQIDGQRFNLFRVVLNPAGKFLHNYFFRLGFLDGLPGFIMAIMMSLYSLILRVKLYEQDYPRSQ